jgi:hypothetical protein
MSRVRVKANPLASTRKNLVQEQQKETNPLYGTYHGVVRRTDDYTRTGKILVFIAALAKDSSISDGLIQCTWTSPFAGSTPVSAIGKNVEKYVETQKSYGMWMVPPDIDNTVLVAFGDGDIKYPYIVGCVFPDKLNHMVPGMPGGKSYADDSLLLPVAEKNKKDERTTHNDAIRPVAPYLAEGIVKQGLINDPIRGPGTAGARRESPSQVFGILTPGPLKPGSSATTTEVNAHRMGGHQFIMDDNPGSSMIRFRTAGGAQLMLDDTTGSIYMINKEGTAWFELSGNGDINLYGEGKLSIRAKQDLNIRADYDINIEAGHNVKIKAAGDNVAGDYLGLNSAPGLGPLGTGGSIFLDAAGDIRQFADGNFRVTAQGGDVDFSGAGFIRATSSGGIHLVSNLGPIAIETTSALSLKSGGTIGIQSPGITSIGSPGGIYLNDSRSPPVIVPGLKAESISPIAVNEYFDQPDAPPEFDLEAALDGKAAVKNKGNRSGKQDTIKSIISCLVTAEPYAGHYNGESTGKEDPTAQGADESVTAETPPAASTTDGKPDDAQTPGGSQAGDGYVDSNGNTVSQPSNAPSVASRARNAVASAQTTAQGAVGSATKALNDAASKASAEISKLADAIPTYADIQNAINDFTTAMEKKIDEVLGLSAFVASIKAQLPPIRFPVVNALKQDIIASMKQLKEIEAQLKQFSLDKLGLPIDLNIPAIQDMKNQINGVMAQAKDGLDAVNKLKELGIDVINDAGSFIYRDSLGNTLVDFAGGLGPVATSLAIQSEMAKTYNNIKTAINVPINNNQAQALAAFAKDIGEENFRNSNVLQALNEGKYNEVPRLMAQWSLGPEIGSNVPTPAAQLVYRQDFNDKRYFQGQVFQSPDNLDIAPPSGTTGGSLTARQMGDLIKARREEFNAANYAGPTEYYAGPGR